MTYLEHVGREALAHLNVRAFPTFIVFRSGGTEFARVVGGDLAELRRRVDSLLREMGAAEPGCSVARPSGPFDFTFRCAEATYGDTFELKVDPEEGLELLKMQVASLIVDFMARTGEGAIDGDSIVIAVDGVEVDAISTIRDASAAGSEAVVAVARDARDVSPEGALGEGCTASLLGLDASPDAQGAGYAAQPAFVVPHAAEGREAELLPVCRFCAGLAAGATPSPSLSGVHATFACAYRRAALPDVVTPRALGTAGQCRLRRILRDAATEFVSVLDASLAAETAAALASYRTRLRSGCLTVLRYEAAELQACARSAIPLEDLTDAAEDDLEGDAAGLSQALRLVKQLLLWFKRDLFTWVNTAPCSRCGNPGTRCVGTSGDTTPGEAAHGASRVELYACGSCGATTRFPRYNDPAKLLETRRGRCGEWANAFGLILRAVGFEARYVMDWEDHVWNEVYDESSGRWVHCDACEAALDRPLLYTVGWKKQLGHVVAFDRLGVTDVGRRYTRSPLQMLARRHQPHHLAAQRALADADAQQRSRGGVHTWYVAARESERLALLDGSDGGRLRSDEAQGRTSGDAAWVAARGEAGHAAPEAAASEMPRPAVTPPCAGLAAQLLPPASVAGHVVVSVAAARTPTVPFGWPAFSRGDARNASIGGVGVGPCPELLEPGLLGGAAAGGICAVVFSLRDGAPERVSYFETGKKDAGAARQQLRALAAFVEALGLGGARVGLLLYSVGSAVHSKHGRAGDALAAEKALVWRSIAACGVLPERECEELGEGGGLLSLCLGGTGSDASVSSWRIALPEGQSAKHVVVAVPLETTAPPPRSGPQPATGHEAVAQPDGRWLVIEGAAPSRLGQELGEESCGVASTALETDGAPQGAVGVHRGEGGTPLRAVVAAAFPLVPLAGSEVWLLASRLRGGGGGGGGGDDDSAAKGTIARVSERGGIRIVAPGLHGRRHPDTRFFREVDFGSDVLAEVRGVRLWQRDAAVGGLQLLFAGSGWSVALLGDGAAIHAPAVELVLERGEHFAAVTGRCGMILDRLTFCTSRGREASAGGDGGAAFRIDLAARLCGLEGGIGGHVHCIGVVTFDGGGCEPLLRDALRCAVGDPQPIVDDALRAGEHGMLRAVAKYLEKIMGDPAASRYRRIKTSAKYYRKHVAASRFGDALLAQVGFRLRYDAEGVAFLKLPRSVAEGGAPAKAKAVLDAALPERQG